MSSYEILALVAIFGFMVFKMIMTSKTQSVPLDIYQNLKELLNKKEVVGIDVRSPGEISRNPSPKSLHIPVGELARKLDLLDKEKTYILFCESGARATGAVNRMKKNGFEKVYNLGSWRTWNKSLS